MDNTDEGTVGVLIDGVRHSQYIGEGGTGKRFALQNVLYKFLFRIAMFDDSAEKKLADAEIRKNRLHFGLVFQSFNLFPQYTALENYGFSWIVDDIDPNYTMGDMARKRLKTSKSSWRNKSGKSEI